MAAVLASCVRAAVEAEEVRPLGPAHCQTANRAPVDVLGSLLPVNILILLLLRLNLYGTCGAVGLYATPTAVHLQTAVMIYPATRRMHHASGTTGLFCL